MMSVLVKLSLAVLFLAISWQWYGHQHRLPPVVEGFFRPEYRPVAELFRKQVEEGTERGGSFAVYQRGEPLIEIWGGYADQASRRPWRDDTITIVWSSTKGVCAITLGKLVERGLLDYKKEVHKYWPEFAQNGKSNITVEMLLSHQAGLGTLGGASVSLLEYKDDWNKVEKVLASAKPDFPPGTKAAYHALTFGMYVDALIRKVDPSHRNLSQFFNEEIARPYGIDFYIGLPRELYHRSARVTFTTQLELMTMLLDTQNRPFAWDLLARPSSYFAKTLGAFDLFPENKLEVLNDPHHMEVGVGSMMGYGSASSLAKLYDFLANGGSIGDKTLLPKEIVDLFSVSLTDSLPSAFSENLFHSFSQGFTVDKDALGTRFGHMGFGGQQARADPYRKFGISYVTNFNWPHIISPPENYLELERLFYTCYDSHVLKSQV